MSFHEVMIEGTLQPDGTLQLDEKPKLAPGRVTVVLRQEEKAAPLQEDWFQFMLSARKKMEAAGCRFMDEKEVQAHIERLREGDPIDELLQEAEKQHQKPEQP
jgi:hypothetical protein